MKASDKPTAAKAAIGGLVAILLVQATLLVGGAWTHSPTLNEPAHLAAGLHHLATGDFSMYRVNPPLVRTIAAVPVAVVGYEADWSGVYEGIGARPAFAVGSDLVAANGPRTMFLLSIARMAVIPLTLLGTVVCYRWSREIFDSPAAGLAAAALWAAEPFVLGHGSLMSPDAHAASLGVAAGYTFWRWLRRPTWGETLISGLVLGLAEAAKTTMVLLIPLWPLIWVAVRWRQRRSLQAAGPSPLASLPEAVARPSLAATRGFASGRAPHDPVGERPTPPSGHSQSLVLRLTSREEHQKNRTTSEAGRGGPGWIGGGQGMWPEAGMLVVRMVLALYVLNMTYLGQGFGTPIGEFRFVSELLSGVDRESIAPGGRNRFADSVLASLPVPLPAHYVVGIDVQQRDFERYFNRSYVRGQWSESGWWWYYGYVLLVKLPTGTLGLLTIAGLVTAGFGVRSMWCWHPAPTVAKPTSGSRLTGRSRIVGLTGADSLCVLAPPAIIFAVASFKSGFSEHGRYVLPCLPFLYVWVGGLFAWPGPRRVLATVLLAATVIESGMAWPHSIAFFNQPSGGLVAGPRHLAGSNVDWGQDLGRLARWADQHADAHPVFLAFPETMYEPTDLYGKRFDRWPAALSQAALSQKVGRSSRPPVLDGWYAVAAGLLHGDDSSVEVGSGRSMRPNARLMRHLRSLAPAAEVGATVRVFTAEQVRAAWDRRL